MSASQRFRTSFAGVRGLWLVAPYAAWMVMMAVLPRTASFYALRGAVTAALLAFLAFRFGVGLRGLARRSSPSAVCLGALSGAVVLAIWIAPETWFGAGSPVAAADSPYSPEVCGWCMTAVKLAASAFVIPVAEELFFRRWLVDFAGFWWMVALFAVEHGERWHVGAVAGVVYGLVARRHGLWSAIIAHVVTNLGLGLIVVAQGRWQFW